MIKLKSGNYYGSLIRKADLNGLLLSETSYNKNSYLPNHEHENIFFCFVLRGQYSEISEFGERNCEAGTLIFHPRFEKHKDNFGYINTKCFNIEINNSWLNELTYRKEYLKKPYHFNGGYHSNNFYKIYRNFVEFDEVSELVIHGNLLNLIAELIRINNPAKTTIPSWLNRVKEKLNDCVEENIDLKELSKVADVHPVHLSRSFKNFFNCTPGEYLRKIRIEKSISLLRNRNIPLAEISFKCGFSDQSHFTRIFRKFTGITPKEYRRITYLR